MDYPRDYIIPNQEINWGTAFVVMPIRSEFDIVLNTITKVCKGLKITAQRADDISRQDIIMANILDGIAKSEIVIVDITGNNPNVFYELGIAHSLRARQSIIIITQDEDVSRSPFDIRHWSILKYDINSIGTFKANLRKKIKSNREAINYDEYLFRVLKSHSFDRDDILQFISLAKGVNNSNVGIICNILADNINISLCNRNKVHELNTYLTTLTDYKDGIFAKIAWCLKFLVFTSDFVFSQYIDTIKGMFLKDWKRDSIDLKDTDHWEFVAKVCCRIVEKQHSDRQEAIDWLTSYLRNARMGRIDRVRTMIEDFLLTIEDEKVDEALTKLLVGNSRTAKESAIDICGQKPILGAIDNLLKIIVKNEPDPHIIRSSINALTRMNVTTAGPIILDWMKNNQDKWGTQAVSSSLKSVAEKALSVLDRDSYNQLIIIKQTE
ncbi:MAG: hypothetical protein II838_14230 [Lachnospiraceae bacterium]|nr:hypothetical protein [Lachnospiraceae bacterium]